MHELRLYSRARLLPLRWPRGASAAVGFRQPSTGHWSTVDIDHPQTPPEWKARYDLEVPVLALDNKELPRVSPRLSGDGLLKWLVTSIWLINKSS